MPNSKTKKFWTENIWKLLKQQSVPAVIWMLVMAFYNFVDTAFIWRMVWWEWIAAISIVFPVYMIIWAVASSLWVWSASIISRALWSKNFWKINKTFSNYQILMVGVSILLTIWLRFFREQLLYLFGVTPDIFQLTMDYFSVIIIWIFFIWFAMWNNNIVRSIWAAKTAMAIMIIWAVLNIILDPILISKYWMEWAARATIISRIVSWIYIVRFYLKKQKTISIPDLTLKLDFKIIKEIIYVWMPSFFRQSAVSIILIIVNNLLWFYWWSLAIAAYWMINRVMMMFNMPMFGIGQWMQPIIWYNHWAKLLDREKQTLFLATKIVLILWVVVSAFYFFFPQTGLRMFTTDPELLSLSAYGMRIVIFTLASMWFQVIASAYYQAIWYGKKALIISILRPIIIFIPMVYLLSNLFGLNGIWFAFPVADIISWVIVFYIMKRDIKRFYW